MGRGGAWSVEGSAEVRRQIQTLTQASREFSGMIDDGLEPIAEYAKRQMDHYSDLSKNRITEDMVNALASQYVRKDHRIRMGFINGLKTGAGSLGHAAGALYQELQTITGFRHLGGEFIAPSFAIRDAKLDVQREINVATRRIRRNFMQRIRRRG